MIDMRIDDFSSKCGELAGTTEYRYVGVSPSIEFSNTGRRGKKYFSMPLTGVLQSLIDIKENLEFFEPHMMYVESEWRRLFETYFTDPAANALANTQSLPTFAMLGKTIHVANQLAKEYDQNYISLSDDNLQAAIDFIKIQVPDDKEYLNNLNIVLGKSLSTDIIDPSHKSSIMGSVLFGENKIFYGAPGTGKSYAIDEIVKGYKHVSTVFHPDTQYNDFVGCLKPSMNGSDVEYKFREGPFCKALKIAHENPQEHCYLVIEEINRASAAAVFGEIFQLLDRVSSGGSKYGVDINDPDMLTYLTINASSVIQSGQLKLPSNLSIYATMNSSDQAVMPMDTAFKRRWRFEYKAIDFNYCANGSFIIFNSESKPFTLTWKNFSICMNECLAEQGIPEDRHLGPWFLSNEELQDEQCASNALTGKLFMYLWDDVLRHGLSDAVFDPNIKNYGQLVHKFKSGEPVFSERLLDRFQSAVGVGADLSLVAEPKAAYTAKNNLEE